MFDNLFVVTRTIFFSLWNADWQRAQGKGGLNLVSESLQSLIGTNTWPFFVSDDSEWNYQRMSSLLDSHGIAMWGWGHSRGQYYFRVKKRQAQWAQYVLLKYNVPLRGRLVHNHSAEVFAPGRNGVRDLDFPPNGQSTPSSQPFNLIDDFNRWVDKLGRL